MAIEFGWNSARRWVPVDVEVVLNAGGAYQWRFEPSGSCWESKIGHQRVIIQVKTVEKVCQKCTIGSVMVEVHETFVPFFCACLDLAKVPTVSTNHRSTIIRWISSRQQQRMHVQSMKMHVSKCTPNLREKSAAS